MLSIEQTAKTIAAEWDKLDKRAEENIENGADYFEANTYVADMVCQSIWMAAKIFGMEYDDLEGMVYDFL